MGKGSMLDDLKMMMGETTHPREAPIFEWRFNSAPKKMLLCSFGFDGRYECKT
jgi:hypothetical protein